MTEPRDERIAAALAELEVPAHEAGFWVRLDTELAQVEPEPERRPPRRRAVWGRPALVVALAAAIALTVLILPQDHSPLRTQPASAAEIAAQVRRALGSAESLSGVVRIYGIADEGGNLYEERFAFAITARGDYRVEQLFSAEERAQGRRSVQAYDSATRTATDVSLAPGSAEGVDFAQRTVGAAPGGFDQEAALPDFLRRDLGATVAALASAGDASVREIALDGRPAWRLASRVRYEGRPGGRVVAVVDQQTAVPLRITQSVDGRVIWNVRLEDPVVDGEAEAGRFRPALPNGVRVTRRNLGFRPTTVERVAAVAGFEPPLPSSVPQGFELDEIAVNTRPQPTGLRLDNPVAGPAVAVSYRRGLQQLSLTMRPTGPDPGRWSDPFVGEGFAREHEKVTLRRGALAGARADVSIDPLGPPQLWALDDELVVTLSGSLGRDELVRLAESLR